MKRLRALLVMVTAAGTLVVAAPAFAIDAPFPMNPYPGQTADYTFNLQTLFGHGSKVRPTTYCANSSVFRRGYQIVFRLYMVNAKSAKVMNGKDISSMVLKVAGQPDVKMGFKPQGGTPDATAPWLWAAAWVVPADYPLGTFRFNIVATLKTNGKPGKSVTYDPVIPGTAWEITP